MASPFCVGDRSCCLSLSRAGNIFRHHPSTHLHLLKPDQQHTLLAPPWHPTAEQLHLELADEVGTDHLLSGKRAVAVARRLDTDDVLFSLPDGPAPLAVVHLAWAGRERSPQWPATELYRSLDDFITRRMLPDASEPS